MMKTRYIAIALTILLTTLNTYAFRFFGIEVDGNLDEVTEKLNTIGFTPVTVEPKSGDYAGEKVVFGNDSLRVLKGSVLGFPVHLDISTDNKGIVDMASFEYTTNEIQKSNKFAGELFKYLCDKYDMPEPIIIKKLMTDDELEQFIKMNNGDDPDTLAIWEFKNVIIIFRNYFSKGKVECTFKGK